MCHRQYRLFWNKNLLLISRFQMHDDVQDLCPVTWNIFPGNSNVKNRVYENTFKIFLTIHQSTLPYWCTNCSIWICLHKNHQRHVWTKTGIHHILQSDYFSHGATRLLSSDLHNWTLGTQDQKNEILRMCRWFWSDFFTKDDSNHLLDSLKEH